MLVEIANATAPLHAFCLQTLICTNCPSTHPFISDEEKRFLRKHIRQARCRDEKPMATPWKAILTSGPVLALIVAEVRILHAHN